MASFSPKDHAVADFDYNLPQEKIAAFPLTERDQSKLLIYQNGKIEKAIYHQIDQHIQSDSLLVFNNTKVVQARLHFKTEAGAIIEIFCLEPEDKSIEVNLAMQVTGRANWKCLVGGLRKWKEDVIYLNISTQDNIKLSAKLLKQEGDAFIIQFQWTPQDVQWVEILELAGKIPLPPYIKRDVEDSDKERYQTVYAQHDGSVAAPTAGLHFTERVFNNLKQKGIKLDYLTLHIGAGTFKPVKSDTIAEHEMHSEQIVVEKAFVKRLIDSLDKDVVAVGTTSLRTLESLYWIGLRISKNMFHADKHISVEQWDPYTLDANLTAVEALTCVLNFLEQSGQNTLLTRTQLIIVPGYQFKVVNTLATNFHQPKSTLIMLVAAFIGEDWRKVYDYALSNDFRFLSYGDGSLLFR